MGGGLNGGSTEFAHLYVVATMDIAKARNLSYAAFFVDLQTAFASIARMIAFPAPSSFDSFASKLFSIGFSKHEVNEITEGIMAYEYWTVSGGSDHYLAMLSRLHKCSWFAVEGVAGCVETTSGALAGNSLGDFVFLMAFSRVLVAVETALADAGLLTMLSPDTVVGSCDMSRSSDCIVEDIPLGSAGYVDDVVQPLMAPACEIVGKMKQCAGIYHHVFSRFGLTINYKKGKTEALFRFAGKGAVSARRALFVDDGGKINFECRGDSYTLIATSTYKHVGTLTCSTDTMQPEITAKIICMNETFNKLRPTFLNRKSIPIQKRILLSQSVLFTKGLFQAGTWPTLHTAEIVRVHKAVMKIYASIYVWRWR